MSEPLTTNVFEFMTWSWERIAPHYQRLIDTPVCDTQLQEWMGDWNRLRILVDETYARLQIANAQNTADQEAECRYLTFLTTVYPAIQKADQKLKENLLNSGLSPAGFEIPLRNMRAESELFREANLPLMAEEHKLGGEYNRTIGAQTVRWEGEEITPARLRAKAQVPDREIRQKAWRLSAERALEDRDPLGQVWSQLISVRRKLAENAGLPGYRSFRWKQLLRFDYTPADCRQFHRLIEELVVPAASRIYEKYSSRLSAGRLRPWDLDQDLYPLHFPPLRVYGDIQELESQAEAIFHRLDPQLGRYFSRLRAEELLDLENRLGKAPGGFCTQLASIKRPFIFMNAVGLASDVRTLLHESGHAFHVFERLNLPYHHQWRTGMEFAEVASMAMELLASSYLPESRGGPFTDQAAARSSLEHYEKIILFWPYMAVVDAFQHWAYENPDKASVPELCNEQWASLWRRFIPGVDWSGLEDVMATGWQRKLHIFRFPFYYIEYGIAQLAAVQVWRNAQLDQAKALTAYRQALALGGTAPLPQLYEAAGAHFTFERQPLQQAVQLLEEEMERLEAVVMRLDQA